MLSRPPANLPDHALRSVSGGFVQPIDCFGRAVGHQQLIAAPLTEETRRGNMIHEVGQAAPEALNIEQAERPERPPRRERRPREPRGPPEGQERQDSRQQTSNSSGLQVDPSISLSPSPSPFPPLKMQR